MTSASSISARAEITQTPTEELQAERRRGPVWRWRLHVLVSPDASLAGSVREISGVLRVGRAPEAAHVLRVADPLLSRNHADIHLAPRGDGLTITDLASHNGTWRAGERVTQARLGHDALVRLGSTLLLVEAVALGEASAREAPRGALRSAWLERLELALSRAAATRHPVLLVGETGAGKTTAASALAGASTSDGSLCAIAAPGLDADALDQTWKAARADPAVRAIVVENLEELSGAAQLRVLAWLEAAAEQRGPRLIATTSVGLHRLQTSSSVRQDLLARFREHVVQIPALRERRPDILTLADAIVPLRAGWTWRSMLEADAAEAVVLHPWHHNLWELKAYFRLLAERVNGARLGLGDLPPLEAGAPAELQQPALPVLGSSAPDAAMLHKLLARYHGRVEAVAQHLGRHRKQVYRWLARAGIQDEALARYRRGV